MRFPYLEAAVQALTRSRKSKTGDFRAVLTKQKLLVKLPEEWKEIPVTEKLTEHLVIIMQICSTIYIHITYTIHIHIVHFIKMAVNSTLTSPLKSLMITHESIVVR